MESGRPPAEEVTLVYNTEPNRPAGPPNGGQNVPYYPPVVSPAPPVPPVAGPYRAPPPVYPPIPGNPVPYYIPAPAGMGQGKAVASLVLGIIGVVLCQIVFISLPCQIIGLILGILAKRQRAGGMAIAGIVLSCVGLAFSLLVLFFVILGLIMAMRDPPSNWIYDAPYDACLRWIRLAVGR